MSNDVTAVYPGWDVVRASDFNYRKPFARLMERETNHVTYGKIVTTLQGRSRRIHFYNLKLEIDATAQVSQIELFMFMIL